MKKSNPKRRGAKEKERKRPSQRTSSLVTGVISVHQKGFGFVKAPPGPDVFIPKHATQQAVDGDTVEIAITGSDSPKGPEGEVIAILERSKSHLACTVFSTSDHEAIAFAPLINRQVVIQKSPLQVGDRIVCQVLDWGSEQTHILATAGRKIGHISDATCDIPCAVEEYELPDGFTKEAIDQALSYGGKVTSKDFEGRLDLTHLESVTIDPDTARDFDDAITLEKDSHGQFHLGVHIADVAHYVPPGSALDKDALLRCNSTYFPGQCIPMLPEALSNELCSLKPNVNRLTQSVLATFSPQGELIEYKIARTVIKSRRRFTYKEAFAVLEAGHGDHSDLLRRMVELCHFLKRQRISRGSIDFSMAENALILDKKGEPIGIDRIEYDITHQMIEEFMLKANELVALHLDKQGKQLIYRIHEEPTEDSFHDFFAFARALGFAIPGTPTRRDIQELFQKALNTPFQHQLSVAFIRSLRLANYSPDNIGHYGLALTHYTHFTSPIRRYTDLIIERLLTGEISGDTDLSQIATLCSERERISWKAEHSVRLLKKLRFALRYFNEDPSRLYPAIITSVKPFALFFEVKLFDIEGSFHVSEIGNDFYEYNPKRMAFRGVRTHETYAPGQEIQVRLEQVDLIHQRSKWSLVSK